MLRMFTNFINLEEVICSQRFLRIKLKLVLEEQCMELQAELT